MPQVKSPKHSPDHYSALNKIPYISGFVFLSIIAFTLVSAVRMLRGNKFGFENPTWYDYLTGAVIVAAAGTTVSLWSKLKSEHIKRQVKSTAALWLISCALYMGYFHGPQELSSWKGLGLGYIVVIGFMLFLVSRRLDEPMGRKHG